MRRVYGDREIAFRATDRDHWWDWLIIVPLAAAWYVGLPIGFAVIVWSVIA